LQNDACGLPSVDGWVQGNSSCAVLP